MKSAGQLIAEINLEAQRVAFLSGRAGAMKEAADRLERLVAEHANLPTGQLLHHLSQEIGHLAAAGASASAKADTHRRRMGSYEPKEGM